MRYLFQANCLIILTVGFESDDYSKINSNIYLVDCRTTHRSACVHCLCTLPVYTACVLCLCTLPVYTACVHCL